MANENNYLFKLILINSSGTGKSNILSRYTKNTSSEDIKAIFRVEFNSK
jgi:Ras-related protein Rab-11A